MLNFCLSCIDPTYVLVVGSNLKGAHGRGGAKHAKLCHGAKYGVAEGMSGNTYLLPTKDEYIKTLPISRVKKHVDKFLDFARSNPDIKFFLTPVGCGLAGYTPSDIAPMFETAPENVLLPKSFLDVYEQK